MQNNEKNKTKYNLIRKQALFVILVLLWIVMIVFKNSLPEPYKWLFFAVLVIVTIVALYYINRSFFGLNGKNDE